MICWRWWSQAQWEHARPAAASQPSSSSHGPSTSFFGRLQSNVAELQQQWSLPLPNRSDLTSLVSQMGYHAAAPAAAATPPAPPQPRPSEIPSASAAASQPCTSCRSGECSPAFSVVGVEPQANDLVDVGTRTTCRRK